tara:strand:+ start:52 stop:732 length:681 start_codon:yes stop_codon:yes gene_type:complete
MKRIIQNLLLATIVILSSCSKEDDLLKPIPNPPTNITTTDTLVTTNGNNGTTTIEYTPNENLVVDNGGVVQTGLGGTKWEVTYNSFYLNNTYPICPMPYDTLIFEEWNNMGEVYFSNEGDGYFETHTYLIDCASMFNEPFLNYWAPNPNTLMTQPIDRFIQGENEIVVNVTNSTGFQYTITLDIIEQTNTKLILENKNGVHSQQINGQGYPTDWDRNVRLELEKVN